MTEPAHYSRGPSGGQRWLICTDSPNAEAGYPDSTSDPADEGTAAHWLLEQCLTAGQDCQDWVDASTALLGPDGGNAVPAGDETGTVKDWPITGEMIEAVQLHIDTVKPDIEKKGTRAFFEERVRLDGALGLSVPVGGTADTILYLPRSKTLKIIDFKYGKGHVVEAKCSPENIYEYDEATGKWIEAKGPDWGINPQLGMYALASLVELERLLGEKREVKTIEIVIVQPRAYHKKGPVRKIKITPTGLMKLEMAIVEAITGPQVRIPGDHCHFCRAKPDCAARAEALGQAATSEFTAEEQVADKVSAAVDASRELATVPADASSLPALMGTPAKGMTLQSLGQVRALAPVVRKWLAEVEEEIKVRLMHDLKVPGARLGMGRGKRAFGGHEDDLRVAAARTADELGIDFNDLHKPAALKSPAELEKDLGKGKFAKTTLASMVSYTAGGPVVVDEDSDTPDWVPNGGFEAEAEAPPEPESKPEVSGSHLL